MPEVDYILKFTFPADRDDIEEQVQGAVFLTRATGTSSRVIGNLSTTSVYFDTPADRDEAQPLFDAIEEIEAVQVDQERVDWLERYQQSLQPLRIGRRFVVVPDVSLLTPDEERIPIVIPQERAFGTGSHESTALCLQMLERSGVEGQRCIDIGTGSGILAIAMRKLGAGEVVAFDNDYESMTVLLLNLERNGVGRDELRLFCGTADALACRAGVVTMNILPEVIIPALPSVRRLLAPNGELILSGVIEAWRDHVVAAAEATGLTLLAETRKGEWWCGVFTTVD